MTTEPTIADPFTPTRDLVTIMEQMIAGEQLDLTDVADLLSFSMRLPDGMERVAMIGACILIVRAWPDPPEGMPTFAMKPVPSPLDVRTPTQQAGGLVVPNLAEGVTP